MEGEKMSSIDDTVIYIDNTRRDIEITEIIMEICQGRYYKRFSSVQLLSHGLQHARLPCPSPTPGAYSNSCPSRQWCHPTMWFIHKKQLYFYIPATNRKFKFLKILFIQATENRWYFEIHIAKNKHTFYRENNKTESKDI